MAREFIARGNFLWNSGMFCFKGCVLEELKLYALKYMKL
jgi:mannose-1-phosphate guanylyltransferase